MYATDTLLKTYPALNRNCAIISAFLGHKIHHINVSPVNIILRKSSKNSEMKILHTESKFLFYFINNQINEI